MASLNKSYVHQAFDVSMPKRKDNEKMADVNVEDRIVPNVWTIDRKRTSDSPSKGLLSRLW